MRDDSRDTEMRIDCAKAAAPYVHPKLTAVEHSGNIDSAVELTDATATDVARAIAFTLAKATRPTAH